MRGYQCIRTDRAGYRNKGGVLTLVKSNINVYLSGSSTDSAEYQVVKIKTKTKEIHLVNYYNSSSPSEFLSFLFYIVFTLFLHCLDNNCPNNVNLDLLNIPVVRTNFIIVGDFNSHSQSWGYTDTDTLILKRGYFDNNEYCNLRKKNNF